MVAAGPFAVSLTPTPLPTAQELLAEKQRAFPPNQTGANAQRVADIVAALQPGLPAELSALLTSDRVAIGEIGEAHPDVATWPSVDRFVVTFSSGMFDFVDTIVHALSARFIDNGSGEAASAIAETVRYVRDALTVYRRQTNLLWSLFRPKFAVLTTPLSPAAAAFGADLVLLVRRFLLAHELGHVAMGAGIRPSLTTNEENDADEYGLEFALKSVLADGQAPFGLGVAAAGLAIRFYVSLERYDARFTKAYPPMSERLATLQSSLGGLVGSQQRVDEVSRVLVALLDFMDDLDNQIQPSLPPIPLTPDRIRVGVIARLYELSREGITQATFISDLDELAQASSVEAVALGLTQVCDYYWDWANTQGLYIRDLASRTTYEHGWLITNSRALRAAIPNVSPTILHHVPPRYAAISGQA